LQKRLLKAKPSPHLIGKSGDRTESMETYGSWLMIGPLELLGEEKKSKKI